MPQSLYVADPPPTFTKHLLAHAWDAWIALGSFYIGLRVVLSSITGSTWSLTIDSLPVWQGVTIGLLHLVAASLLLLAIFDNDSTPWRQWGLERTALTLLCGAWLSWLLASHNVSGSGVLQALSFVLVGAAVTRALGVSAMKRRAETRATVRATIEGV